MTEVLENEIILYYSLGSFNIDNPISISDFIEQQLGSQFRAEKDSLAEIIPNGQLRALEQALSFEEKKESLWLKNRKSDGRYEHKADLEDSLFNTIRSFELNPKLQKLVIEPAKQRKHTKIDVCLNNSAIGRLGKQAEDKIQIALNNVAVHAFSDGPDILELSLSVLGPLSLAELCETVYALVRFNTLQWGESPDFSFRLGQLVSALVGKTSERSARVRATVYGRVCPDADSEEICLQSTRIAKHLTSDYMINSPEDLEVDSYQPFENVVHALSFEGTCTMVAADERSPEALRHFYNNAFKNAYAPLAMVQHQHLESLMELSRKLSASNTATNPEALKNIFAEATRCNIGKGSPIVSRLQLHNSYYTRLATVRNTTSINSLVIEKSRSLAEYIDSLATDLGEKRMFKLELLSIVGVTFLTVFTITKEVMSALGWLSHGSDEPHCLWSGALWPCASNSIIPIGVAVTLGLAAFVWTYRARHFSNNKLRHISTEHAEHTLFHGH